MLDGSPIPAPQVDPLMPEVMMGTATSLLASECSAMVVGCGLGVSGEAVRALKSALKREVPLAVDADALNLIAQSRSGKAHAATNQPDDHHTSPR